MIRRLLLRSPVVATLGVFVLLYAVSAIRYPAFTRPNVFLNLFSDHAALGIAAVGITLVIISGGIDLSVGAMIGFTSVVLAVLIEQNHLHPMLAVLVVLLIGTALGTGMGWIIRTFALPPFLVTLAGMFFARGMGLVVSLKSLSITDERFTAFGAWEASIGSLRIPSVSLVFLAVVALGAWLGRYTRFGRNVYAIGGSEDSAVLMGLPVGATKIRVYAFSAFCSALAGVIFALKGSSGYAHAGAGLEMDAIAATVVGGTLLSGGVGAVPGTLVGVLIFGVIQTLVLFENLNSWWGRIAIGLLLLMFVLVQRIVTRRAA